MEDNHSKIDSEQVDNAQASTSSDNKNDATPETHLQSLGLVVNNGKPRFKIGEPAFATGPSTSYKAEIDTDDEDTMSFVVLDRESVNMIENSSRMSYQDIQQKSMSIDYNSILLSLSTSEIQQKLSDLLQENVKLKETLKQNNDAMKQQFNTLASWQEEVMRIHQNHKQKFAETRDLVKHLKNENMELKLKLSMTDHTSNTKHEYEAVEEVNKQDETPTSVQASAQTEEIKSTETGETDEAEEIHASMETFIETEDYESLDYTEINEEEANESLSSTPVQVPLSQAATHNFAVQTPVENSAAQTSSAQISTAAQTHTQDSTQNATVSESTQSLYVEVPVAQSSTAPVPTQSSHVETVPVQTYPYIQNPPMQPCSYVQNASTHSYSCVQTPLTQSCSCVHASPIPSCSYAQMHSMQSSCAYMNQTETDYCQSQNVCQGEAAACAQSECYAYPRRRKDKKKRKETPTAENQVNEQYKNSPFKYCIDENFLRRLLQGFHVRVGASIEGMEEPINLSTQCCDGRYATSYETQDNDPNAVYGQNRIFGTDNISVTVAPTTIKYHVPRESLEDIEYRLSTDYEAKDPSNMEWELKKCKEACEAKDKEINYLKKLTRLMEEKSDEPLQDRIPLKQIVIEQPRGKEASAFQESRAAFIDTVKKYNEMMEHLTETFAFQSMRFCKVEKTLKQIMNILGNLRYLEVARKHPETGELQIVITTEFEEYKERLQVFERELLDEEISIIDDRQVLIRAVNDLQSLFTDYNNILFHVEIIHEENNKLSVMNRDSYFNSKEANEFLKQNEAQKRLIMEERLLLKRIKSELEEERRYVDSQKKTYEDELTSIQKERQSMQDEKIALQAERASLDQQSKLYDSVLQSEKKMMSKRYEELNNQNKYLQRQIQEQETTIADLRQDLIQKTQKLELLETQLKLYEEDFKEESRTKKAAIEEKGKLDEVFRQQLEMNLKLRKQVEELQRLARAKRGEDDTPVQTSPPIPCPVCSEYFTSGLEEHVERCLNSQ